ncbi:hypothetical protein FBF34_01780 [Arachnia propionica]|uniref:Lecithin:cholesterol acyltransferase n=1 Tax=Arachnia propionica TaxID=1750 RepID=A0AB37HWL6_9ACTN|nr:lecithin:cholesterol acyltransferase domain protein [Arachnia propionica]AFN45274.1 lecithin:cholesterol acyltransferase domain protein [Arachnia propionica F0230a]QCT36834.1 hypothetical protein FBF34_01780 [Arachnia propionica]QUC10827.1 hypothetical protein J5A53_13855 [Arachnia propionica]RPA17710.1 hypothetical protein EGT56_06795 [Arachnia propionica]
MTKLDHLFVIVPGIGGSVLADESGKKVWKPDVRSVGKAMCRPEDLAIDRPLVPTGLFTDFHITPFWLVPGYSKITKRLAYVFQEAVTTAHPTDHVDPDASIVNFPYDFRKSIWKSAEALGREIAWRLEHRKRRVVIYAHSMGGLVAAWWWGMLDGYKVTEHIITLGTPFRGATKALDMLVNGVRLGSLPLDAATGVLRGWDSIYDLVPKYRTIRDADADVYPHDLSLASEGFRRRAKTSYERFQEMTNRIGELVEDPALLGAWTHFYSEGHGTLSRAEVVADRLVCSKKALDWELRGWQGGDGTVPKFSAFPAWLDKDENTGRRPKKDTRRSSARHGQLVEDGAAWAQVEDFGLPDLPPPARGAGEDKAYVLLDHDDVVPAGQPTEVGIRLDAPDPGNPEIQVTLTGEVVDVSRSDDGWVAHLPEMKAGLNLLEVTFRKVPDLDEVSIRTKIGAVDVPA